MDPNIWFRPFRSFKAFIAKPDLNTSDIPTPKTYAEATASPHAEQWKAAMDKEINENSSRNIYTLVLTPKGTRILGGKWVYTVKPDENGKLSRFKARWVVQGFR